jgi:hypothetical protein
MDKTGADILRGLLVIMEGPHADKIYVGKDFTKRDVINAVKTVLGLEGEEKACPRERL